MKVEIIKNTKCKRVDERDFPVIKVDEDYNLNSGLTLSAKYVEKSGPGHVNIHMKDGSTLSDVEKSSIKYDKEKSESYIKKIFSAFGSAAVEVNPNRPAHNSKPSGGCGGCAQKRRNRERQ